MRDAMNTPATCLTDAELEAGVNLFLYGTTDLAEVARLKAEEVRRAVEDLDW